METLDEASRKKVPSGRLFNTITILSFAGNGLWSVLFLILLIGCISNGASMMQSTSLASVFGGVVAFFAILSAVIVASGIASIIGVAKMRNGNQSGFFIYAVANGVWTALVFYAASSDGGITYILGGLISLGFIIYFGSLRSKLS